MSNEDLQKDLMRVGLRSINSTVRLPLLIPKSFLVDVCGWTEQDVQDAVDKGELHTCDDMYVPDEAWAKELQNGGD